MTCLFVSVERFLELGLFDVTGRWHRSVGMSQLDCPRMQATQNGCRFHLGTIVIIDDVSILHKNLHSKSRKGSHID